MFELWENIAENGKFVDIISFFSLTVNNILLKRLGETCRTSAIERLNLKVSWTQHSASFGGTSSQFVILFGPLHDEVRIESNILGTYVRLIIAMKARLVFQNYRRSFFQVDTAI
jgi:hypothetical protein